MKLTQKLDHFTVSSLALVAAHRSSCQITLKKLAGWTCEVVSGMFSLGVGGGCFHWVGGGGWTGGKRLQFKIVVGHW